MGLEGAYDEGEGKVEKGEEKELGMEAKSEIELRKATRIFHRNSILLN